MATNAPSTVRARRLRERRSRGVAMVAPVEVGEGGIDLLIRNELLKQQLVLYIPSCAKELKNKILVK